MIAYIFIISLLFFSVFLIFYICIKILKEMDERYKK